MSRSPLETIPSVPAEAPLIHTGEEGLGQPVTLETLAAMATTTALNTLTAERPDNYRGMNGIADPSVLPTMEKTGKGTPKRDTAADEKTETTWNKGAEKEGSEGGGELPTREPGKSGHK